jgi:exodeoxyribonuclease VII small subunit
MSDELDSTSFNKNYKVLKDTADWLSAQKEPDIDQLVPKVERAMKAYSICKDRLDKVQATLGQYFQQDGAAEEAGLPGVDGIPRAKPPARAATDDTGENVPF